MTRLLALFLVGLLGGNVGADDAAHWKALHEEHQIRQLQELQKKSDQQSREMRLSILNRLIKFNNIDLKTARQKPGLLIRSVSKAIADRIMLNAAYFEHWIFNSPYLFKAYLFLAK